jgi:hypothetical protein
VILLVAFWPDAKKNTLAAQQNPPKNWRVSLFLSYPRQSLEEYSDGGTADRPTLF